MGNRLVLHTSWNETIARSIDVAGIASLELNVAKGWRASNLEFLDLFRHIRSLELTQDILPDDSAILQMHQLVSLSLGSAARNRLDLAAFPKLEELRVEGYRRLSNVKSCARLRLLYAFRTGPSVLDDVRSLPALTDLTINTSPISSVDTNEKAPPLRRLSLYNLPKLDSLRGISNLTQLEELNIEGCRRFNDISPVGELANLKLLGLDDCGRISSLKPVLGCKKVERLTFAGTTIIEDGRVSDLMDLPNLANTSFMDRRRYDMKCEGIQDLLKAQGRYRSWESWWPTAIGETSDSGCAEEESARQN